MAVAPNLVQEWIRANPAGCSYFRLYDDHTVHFHDGMDCNHAFGPDGVHYVWPLAEFLNNLDHNVRAYGCGKAAEVKSALLSYAGRNGIQRTSGDRAPENTPPPTDA